MAPGKTEGDTDASTVDDAAVLDKVHQAVSETKENERASAIPKKKRKKATASDEPPNKKKKVVKKKGDAAPASDAATPDAATSTKKKATKKKAAAKKDSPTKTKAAKKKDNTSTASPKKKPASAKPTSATTAAKKTTTPTAKKAPAKRRQRKHRSPSPSSPPSPSPPPSPTGPPPLQHAQDLLQQIEFALLGMEPDLEVTKRILEKHHAPTIQAKEAKMNAANNNTANSTTSEKDPIQADPSAGVIPLGTGGHSNTNHQVVLTGDPVLDKLREYQRHYQQRQRQLVPETKGTERWDKPKVLGQRRRRIHREVDRPEAPHEPPPVGFTVFVGQMTTKIRHDRMNEVHHQPTVMQEIAKLWKEDMTEADRQYYNDFARDARAEYVRQQMEFRASGKYTRSANFFRLGTSEEEKTSEQFPGQSHAGGGPWIKRNSVERNALEQEISTYETVNFAPRPPELDDDYQWRDWKSKLNRKLKLKKLITIYSDPVEQEIVGQALDHAKHDIMDASGETIHTVDHSALLARAQHECVAKLEEVQRVNEMADSKPPGDDPEEQQRALRLFMFTEDDAMIEVDTDDEEADYYGDIAEAEEKQKRSQKRLATLGIEPV